MFYDHYFKENGIKFAESKIHEVVGREIIQQKLYNRSFCKELETEFQALPRKCAHTRDFLYLSNMLIALQEQFTFKFRQILSNNYTWITPATTRQCYKIMSDAFGFASAAAVVAAPEEEEAPAPPMLAPMLSMEETIIIAKNDDAHAKIDALLQHHQIPLLRLTARVDLITEDTIWELKCTSNISVEHLMQVVIYAWIWRVALEREPREFKILNIKTGEIRCLNATNDQLTQIMLELFRHKSKRGRRTSVNDALFDDTTTIIALNE
jgi:hypothetical protein